MKSMPAAGSLTTWSLRDRFREHGWLILAVTICVAVGVFTVVRAVDMAGLALAGVLGCIGYLIARKVGGASAEMTIKIFLIAFAVRIIAVYLVHYAIVMPHPDLLAPDSLGYDAKGLAIAQFWKTGIGMEPPAFPDYRTLAGLFSYVAPGSIFLPRVLNCFVGSLTAVFVAKTAADLFGSDRAGKISGLAICFLPSFVMWSIVNLKDADAIFAVSLVAYVVVQLRHRSFWSMSPILILAFCILASVRAWALVVVAIGFGVGMLLSLPRRPVRVFVTLGLGALLMVLLFSAGAAGNRWSRFTEKGSDGVRQANTQGGSAISHAPLPVRFVVVSLGPVPGAIEGPRGGFAVPEIIVLWCLIPSVVRGVRRGLRRAVGATTTLVAIGTLMLLAIAQLEGNLGLAFRHRAGAFVVLLIFVGGGWKSLRSRLGQEQAPRSVGSLAPFPVPAAVPESPRADQPG
jgi:hypothetical protein